MRGDVHPAMKERGRAIPNTQTVPIVNSRPHRAHDHVQIIDGRVSSKFFQIVLFFFNVDHDPYFKYDITNKHYVVRRKLSNVNTNKIGESNDVNYNSQIFKIVWVLMR